MLCDMVAHMKTTAELRDDLLALAKKRALRQGTTLRSLLEEGLRMAIRHRSDAAPFVLRDASVKGQGVQPGVVEGSWEQVRDEIYEGRGS